MKYQRLLGAAALAVAASLTCAHAQVLLQWNTYGNTGMEVSEPDVFHDPNLAAAPLLLGAGIDTAGNSHRFGGSNWLDVGDANPSTLAEAIPDNEYFQFTVTPLDGASFTATAFVFGWDHSASGAHSLALRSSLDGFAADLGVVTGLAASLTTGNTIALTGLDGLTSAVTFRLYGWGATSISGTGGFDTATNAPNVQLLGTTAAAIPEPSVYATLLAAGALGLAAWRRSKPCGRRHA